MVVERLDSPDLDAVRPRWLLREHHRGDDRIPRRLGVAPAERAQPLGQQRRLADEPTFQMVLSMSPTNPRISPVAAATAAAIVRESQVTDARPAPLRPDHDAVPVVEDPLRALGRVDVEIRILRELGERRSHRAGCAM